MFVGRSVWWGLIFVVLGGSLGCAAKPRVVIADLPLESILEAPARAAPKLIAKRPVRDKATFPQSWTPEALPRPWRWIVIHHSASESGSAATFDQWHRARGWDELGYHF
ncbi:unnamed protein product, partial [marine sediment metagenome]